jgi:hypothetical protein
MCAAGRSAREPDLCAHPAHHPRSPPDCGVCMSAWEAENRSLTGFSGNSLSLSLCRQYRSAAPVISPKRTTGHEADDSVGDRLYLNHVGRY